MTFPRRVGVPAQKPAPQVAAPAPEPASVPETSQAEVTEDTVLKGRAALPAHMRELWETAEGYAQELADEIAKWPEDQRRHGRLIIKGVIAKELLDDAGKAAIGAAAVRRMAELEAEMSAEADNNLPAAALLQEMDALVVKPWTPVASPEPQTIFKTTQEDLDELTAEMIGLPVEPKPRDGAANQAALEQERERRVEMLKSKRGGR